MASVTVDQYVSLIPAVKHSPKQYLWSSYDAEADVLYVNFKKGIIYVSAQNGASCLFPVAYVFFIL